jgi:alkanesulfonate monooxygenase SsuD/methylene tetrahydromethanopterin reductase-like flavin-dependent oxidoreductase (luciferase family)
MIGGSRKRVLALAGREADIVSLANVPWVAVNEAGLSPTEEAVRRVGFARDAAGARFGQLDIETSPYFSEITDSVDEALSRLSAATRRSDPAVLRDHPNVLVGSVARIVDQLEQRRAVIGTNYITVPQQLMDDFAPVCSALAGR